MVNQKKLEEMTIKYQRLESSDVSELSAEFESRLGLKEAVTEENENTNLYLIAFNPFSKEEVIAVFFDCVGKVTEDGKIVFCGKKYSCVSTFIRSRTKTQTVSSFLRNSVKFECNGYASTWGSEDIRQVRKDKAAPGTTLQKIYSYMKSRDNIPQPKITTTLQKRHTTVQKFVN